MSYLSYLSTTDLQRLLKTDHNQFYRFIIENSFDKYIEIAAYASITTHTTYDISMYENGFFLGYERITSEDIKKRLFYDKVNELLK